MNTTRVLSAVLFVFGTAALAGCANSDTTSPTDTSKDGETQTSGIALTSDTLADTDVARMQFGVTGVDCETGEATGFSDQTTKDLEDMMLPGGISQFENAPLEQGSQHLFADAFFLVGAGCYDVETTPLNEQGQASNDCEPAHRDRVSVEDGQTTEVLLINQCRGAEKGGLDAVSAINHPPELQNVEFQKFLSSCPAEGEPQIREVCATAIDPDGDPLEFAWQPLEGAEVIGEVTETSQTGAGDGAVESCAQLQLNQAGEYNFRVRVFDLDGDGNRHEDVISEQEGESVTSRAGVRFPIYSAVDCPVEQPEPQPEPEGRNVTMLMALSQAGPGADIPWLIQNAVLWASPIDDAEASRIGYILDDNHQGEFLEDREVVLNNLRNEGVQFDVDEIEEPEGGITFEQIEQYDVVWFANPAHRMDDEQTFDALMEFQAEDKGLILQGQDMAATEFEDDERSLQQITRLEFVNDGRRACGDRITGTDNVYQVAYTDEPLPVLEALRGRTFDYPSDIDRVRQTLSGEQILANKSYTSGDCSVRAPAISAIDPEAGEDVEEGDEDIANGDAPVEEEGD